MKKSNILLLFLILTSFLLIIVSSGCKATPVTEESTLIEETTPTLIEETTKATTEETAKESEKIEGKIAFLSDRDGNDEIYIMNADSSGQTNLTNNEAEDS